MFLDDMFLIPVFTTGGKMKKSDIAGYRNNIVFQNVLSRYIMDAQERYTIKNLPDTLSERVILQSLMWHGGVVFFSRDGALMALAGAPSGKGINVYGDPASAYVWGKNGFNEEIKVFLPGGDETAFLRKTTSGLLAPEDKSGVYVWENKLRFPFARQVVYYAREVANCLRTIEVLGKKLKAPYIFAVKEELVSSTETFMKKIDNNEDRIYISTDVYDTDALKPLVLPTAENIEKSIQLMEWYENKYRELCGYNSNGQVDKKGENLIQAEISVNDQYEEMNVNRCVDTINEGLEYVNRFFGTNLICEVKHDERKNDVLRNENQNDGVPAADTDGPTSDDQ